MLFRASWGRHRPGRTAGAVSVCLSGLLLAQAARAATPGVDEPLVMLTERGNQDAESTAFFSTVRALAAEIGVAVSTEPVASLQAVDESLLAQVHGQKKPFLVAWILRDNKLRRVYLFDPRNHQLRIRTIEAGESATANAEALALILRAELVAYLHEPPAAPSSTPPSPPSPRPSPAPRPTPAAQNTRWAAAAAYALATFLRGQGMQQGARLGIGYRWRHTALDLRYGLFPGRAVPGQDASITVRRHPVALGIGYLSQEHLRLRWVAETFLSGDWVSRHTSSATSPLSAQPDAGHFLVSVGVRVRQDFRLLRHLALELALDMEVPLNPIEFQVAHSTTTTTLTRSSPVGLGAELGLTIPAW